jgi:hypothetical protein
MLCSVCHSEFHVQDDNWQCGTLASLIFRVDALEGRVREVSRPSDDDLIHRVTLLEETFKTMAIIVDSKKGNDDNG